jgi:hypothetical protein
MKVLRVLAQDFIRNRRKHWCEFQPVFWVDVINYLYQAVIPPQMAALFYERRRKMSEEKPRSFVWDETRKEAVEYKGRLVLPMSKDYKPLVIEHKYGPLVRITSKRGPCVPIERSFKK